MIVLSTTVLACADAPLLEPTARRTEPAVQVRRTSFGIPHIEAENETSLGFGAGYAFAQDNICMLAEEVVTVNGERSLYFGADGAYDPTGIGTTVTNLASDVYFALINNPFRVAASWASQSHEVRDLIAGYTQGVNRFLRDAAGAFPDACRGRPWVREITHGDIIRLVRRFAVEGSGIRMIEAIAAAAPPKGSCSARDRRDASPAHAEITDFQTPLGSNGIALGRDATASGGGLLLASPHFPWNGVLRFYQLHLVIPGQLDVMGATPLGMPFVAIGHNADLAWTHTVNASVHFTFHQLTLDPNDPTRYLVDGASRPMSPIDIDVKERRPDGTIGKRTRRVWMSALGPIVKTPEFDWTTCNAFAFQDANVENSRFVQTWWDIDHAHSLAALRAAVEDSVGIPWVHTLAVDAGGTTYFGDVTPVPNLPDDPTCIPKEFASRAATTGVVVLDGSKSRCGWQIVAGAPAPGIVPGARLPTLVRTDFVQNSNDSAWMTNPAAPITGYPAIISRDRTPQSARTRYGLTFLTGELAAGRRFTAQSLLDFAFSNRAFHARTLLDDLHGICTGSTSDLSAPCSFLDRWDGTANLDSVGWPVYRAWRTALDNAAAGARIDTWRVPFDPADPIGTPRGLRVSDPLVTKMAREALTQSMRTLATLGIDPNKRWGEIQQTRRGDRLIPIHGGGGDLGGGPSVDGGNDIYNKINSRPSGGHLEPFFGTSIVMVISFEGGRPVARGLTTYSQSSDPTSAHLGDQTELFSRREWAELPYNEEAIERDPNLSVLELSE